MWKHDQNNMALPSVVFTGNCKEELSTTTATKDLKRTYERKKGKIFCKWGNELVIISTN
jgi:hypothetical protein